MGILIIIVFGFLGVGKIILINYVFVQLLFFKEEIIIIENEFG